MFSWSRKTHLCAVIICIIAFVGGGIVQAQDAEEEPTVYDLFPRCELSQFNDYADSFLPVFYDGLADILDATEMDLILSVSYLANRGVLGAVGIAFVVPQIPPCREAVELFFLAHRILNDAMFGWATATIDDVYGSPKNYARTWANMGLERLVELTPDYHSETTPSD